MSLLHVRSLPADALDAAAVFHAEVVPWVGVMMEQGVSLITLGLASADHTHRDWRTAAIRQLARRHAPARINMVAGDADVALEAAARYLEKAEGVTGQYLPLDGEGAGPVLGLQP